MKKSFKQIVRENILEFQTKLKTEAEPTPATHMKKPAPKPVEKSTEEEASINSDSSKRAKYEKIEALLSNPIFNNAEIAKGLWGDKDASNRSLFKKKLDMALNDSGEPYEFDEEELSKIGSILRDTSKQITKTVGRKGT